MAEDDLPYSAAGHRSPWLIAVIVSIATFMEVLDTTIANVALRQIAGSLAASQDESTYVLTSYLVSNAIIVPISGWLANVIGRKRFYMLCVALFTVASLLCATSTSLAEMLFWRVVQGLGGGGLAPVEQSMFADSFPRRQQPQAFALYGLTVVMAPALGPLIGGYLTDHLSWHFVFLINVPVGALSLLLVGLFVVDSPKLLADRRNLLRRGLKVDYIGFMLVAVGFGTLQIVLDRFEREGGWGTPFVNLYGSICVVSLAALGVWEWRHPQPVMNVRLLRRLPFALACLLMFAVGFVLISSTQLLPQMAQDLMGYDAMTAGETLGLAGFASIIIMPIAGMVTGRLAQPKYLAALAFSGCALAMWYSSRLTLQADFQTLALSRLVLSVWLPFLFIPIISLSTIGVPADQSNEGSALTSLMRNLGGSVGISYGTTLLAYRLQLHHARLAEHITPYNGYGFGTSLAAIARTLETQASMLTYLDAFRAIGVVALMAVPLALLLPRLPKGTAVGGH